MADDIRRRAEREAAAIRRDAARWASETRLEAERLRDEVLAELDAGAAPAASPEPTGEVIDLRAVAEARRGTARTDDPVDDVDDPRSQAGLDDDTILPPELELSLAPRTAAPYPGTAPGGGVVPAPIETSIETKVHDVVRLAVRRTFERVASAASR